MLYLANPCSDPLVLDAMRRRQIGYIDTPRQGNIRPAGVLWCADNGAFSDTFDPGVWWSWLSRQDPDGCMFAVAPDVVADAAATLARSAPWLSRIRDLGFPVAYVGQDGADVTPPPWPAIDVLFLGGSTQWKLGPAARDLAADAHTRGIPVHMGRVNSERRWAYARQIGCSSADGTILTRGPAVNLRRVLSWTREAHQLYLPEGTR